MNKKHWEEELSDVVKGMTPIEPRFDLRAGVMQQILGNQAPERVMIRPLLSAGVRKIIFIIIALMLVLSFMLTRNVTDSSGSVFGTAIGFLQEWEITLPTINIELSNTSRWALMAISLFTLLQVLNIGRLLHKMNKG